MQRFQLSLALLMAMMGGLGSHVIAAPQWCIDRGGPPCKGGPGGGEDPTAVNRLAYPSLLVPGVSVAPFFDVAEGALGDTYSYACNQQQTITIDGTDFTYPNTTCAELDDLGAATEWLDAAVCTAVGGPCEGLPVDRVYWQKQPENLWSAQATGIADFLPLIVRYLDWGDSIEVVTWNENSVLRVETQPFSDQSQDPRPEVLPGDIAATQVGLQMWHAEGQGTNEQWGVRTTEQGGLQGLPYAYQSPYAIINAGTATLYLSKLYRDSADETTNSDGSSGCPVPGSGETGETAYPGEYPFEGRIFTPGEGWSSACNLPVVPYTLELSVSGKYVHGYNWRMRELTNPLPLAVCGTTEWDKTGWWRLTFVPNGGMEKMIFAEDAKLAAPPLPAAIPTDVSLLTVAAEEEEEEGTLYTPVIDTENNLTYIDICIAPKVKGGGSGKKK